jgi:hypothetical protein
MLFMATHADSTLAPTRDLCADTWTRHAAILRDLALTGPAQHRHVYESAACEAEAHAEAAWAAETTPAAIAARLDRASSVVAIADLLLDPAVQAAMASLPTADRDAIRDHAARRTRALGWDAGRRRASTFRRAA